MNTWLLVMWFTTIPATTPLAEEMYAEIFSTKVDCETKLAILKRRVIAQVKGRCLLLDGSDL